MPVNKVGLVIGLIVKYNINYDTADLKSVYGTWMLGSERILLRDTALGQNEYEKQS